MVRRSTPEPYVALKIQAPDPSHGQVTVRHAAVLLRRLGHARVACDGRSPKLPGAPPSWRPRRNGPNASRAQELPAEERLERLKDLGEPKRLRRPPLPSLGPPQRMLQRSKSCQRRDAKPLTPACERERQTQTRPRPRWRI